MTLKTIQEYFPINKAVVGYFDADRIFKFNTIEDISDAQNWDDPLFIEQKGFFSFVEYIGEYKFREWYFGYTPIVGYFCKGELDDFYPITYNEDFGCELIELDSTYGGLQNVLISPEHEKELNIHLVLSYFPSTNPVFTSLSELHEFLLTLN